MNIIKASEGKKKVFKFIKKEVEKLEPEFYIVRHKQKPFKDENGEWVTGYIQSHKSNLYRQAKRQYVRYGLFGLNDFFLRRGLVLATKNKNI